MEKVRAAYEADATSFDRVFEKYGSGKAKSSCAHIFREITALAQHNQKLVASRQKPISLEDYWKSGRQFSLNNKEVYPGKDHK